MRKVGIDARLYFQTGVGVYLRNLLHYLQKISKNFQFYIYVLKNDSGKIRFTNNKFIKREVNSRWHSLSEQTKFLSEINKDNLDLMHFTYFGYPIFYRKKFIVTVHDLTPVLFKTGKASTKNPIVFNLKHFIFKNVVLSSQIRRSSLIVTPTRSVKEQIVKCYGLKFEKKIIPIYEGVNYELVKSGENKKLAKKYKDFFLYVSNFYPHKNADKLIRAFSKIKNDAPLIMVGPDDYFAKKIKQLVKELKLENRVFFHHASKTDDFVFFYKNAKALVHPSLSEGFGLPIVESIYFRLPIIASDISVFQEILGDKYIEFNPNDQDDIKNKIDDFLKNPKKIDYQNLIKKYSFEEMTKETLEVYKKCL